MPIHLNRLLKTGLALMPLLLIIGGALHSRAPYLRNHPWPPTQLLDADSRREGIHLYGWSNRYVYSAYGTFPSHPEVDEALALSMLSNKQSGRYQELLQDPRHQPITIVDLVAVGKEGLLNGAPSLQELSRRPERGMAAWVHPRVARTGGMGVPAYNHLTPAPSAWRSSAEPPPMNWRRGWGELPTHCRRYVRTLSHRRGAFTSL
jgi:hypothetical protein